MRHWRSFSEWGRLFVTFSSVCIKTAKSLIYYLHQQRTVLSRRHGCLRVDVLHQSCQRHPGGGELFTRHRCHASHFISHSHPRFAVSSCSALSVSYFKQTLWLWGQLWPYIGMSSVGTCLHRHSNGWCSENLFSCSFNIKLEECRKKVRRYDTTRPGGYTQLRRSMKSRKEQVRPKVGKDTVYFCSMIRWDENEMMAIYPRVSRIHTPHHTWTMYLEGVIEQVSRCTLRPRSSELSDALLGHHRASLEMHLEAEMDRTQRCTWRPWSSEFGHAHGGLDQVNSEMHSEAVTDQCMLYSVLTQDNGMDR